MGIEKLKCKTCGHIELSFDNFDYCNQIQLYVNKETDACISHTAFLKKEKIGFKPKYINRDCPDKH